VTRRKGLVSTVALMLAGAVVGLLVVGCGIRPTAVIYGQEAPRGAVSSMVVYLIDHNALRAVARPLPPTSTVDAPSGKIGSFVPADTQALDALLQGPNATEAAGGLTSDIPPDTAGGIIHSDDGGVIVVFIKIGDGGSLTQHAVDQISCTVITAQLTDGTISTSGLRVTVQDNGKRSRTPQKCPLDTP
jgi:hypothetical protein